MSEQGCRGLPENKSETDRLITRTNAKGQRTHSFLMIRYAWLIGGEMDISPCDEILYHIREQNQSVLFLAWLSKILPCVHTACLSMGRNSFPEVEVGGEEGWEIKGCSCPSNGCPTASTADPRKDVIYSWFIYAQSTLLPSVE